MGMFEREKFPSGSILAIILANRSPFAFRKIRTPAPPVQLPPSGFLEAPLFSFHEFSVGWDRRSCRLSSDLSPKHSAQQRDRWRLHHDTNHIEPHAFPRGIRLASILTS